MSGPPTEGQFKYVNPLVITLSKPITPLEHEIMIILTSWKIEVRGLDADGKPAPPSMNVYLRDSERAKWCKVNNENEYLVSLPEVVEIHKRLDSTHVATPMAYEEGGKIGQPKAEENYIHLRESLGIPENPTQVEVPITTKDTPVTNPASVASTKTCNHAIVEVPNPAASSPELTSYTLTYADLEAEVIPTTSFLPASPSPQQGEPDVTTHAPPLVAISSQSTTSTVIA
ncbi:hypothetical protein ACFE04_013215 [Oxalis oulophora]